MLLNLVEVLCANQKMLEVKDHLQRSLTRWAERASNLTFSECLHLVNLNNPRILMTHDKMAVTANIWAQTVQSFQTDVTVSSVVYLY